MRAVLRKPRQLRQVYIGHEGIGREAHLGGISRDIRPVGLEDLARLIGNADPAQHLIAGLRDKAHEVIILEHHFDLLQSLRLVMAFI